MIALFTDFGIAGPYVGQMKAAIERDAPGTPVIDLLHDAPAFDPRASAYLLAGLADAFPAQAIMLCVVDPGVGGMRTPIVAEADGRRFVGPDNGLFELVLRRADRTALWTIAWRPERLSATFHGRDLFAPVAAKLARGEPVPGDPAPVERARRVDWPDDLAEIVHIDGFGNATTGIRAASTRPETAFDVGGQLIRRARIFSERAPGEAFWYENSSGLVEFAVNRGRADEALGLRVGAAATCVPPR